MALTHKTVKKIGRLILCMDGTWQLCDFTLDLGSEEFKEYGSVNARFISDLFRWYNIPISVGTITDLGIVPTEKGGEQ